MTPTVVVIAKAPVAGRVKTRLCPPCTPPEAAGLAEAALRDTLATVAEIPDVRRVVALDGDPGPWLPAGFAVVPQRGVGLAARLAAAVVDVGGPVLVIGSDTPQLTPGVGAAALRTLRESGSVLGAALDGGYWAIGLPAGDPRVFAGVPMSTARTGAVQRARLVELGYRPAALPTLRDVDHFEDAVAVAGAAPASRFASKLRSITRSWPRAAAPARPHLVRPG
ncbi:MAG: TIGR04282 family arsenosugar biosynthesis glycosyltransferase [Acidimicrobiia bacterium]